MQFSITSKQSILPEAQIITYQPNTFIRLIHETHPFGAGVKNVYGKHFHETRRAKYKEAFSQNRSRRFFDNLDRMTQKTDWFGNTAFYTYDQGSDTLNTMRFPEILKHSICPDFPVTMARAMLFEKSKHLKHLRIPVIPHAIQVSEQNDNLMSMSFPNGADIAYEYDVLNRQTSQSYTGSLGTASVDFTLDGNGNVEQKSLNLNGSLYTTTMDFDDLDRMTSKTDWYGNTSFYTYDPNGNRKSYRDYETGVLNYAFDGLNRLTQISKADLGAQTYSYNSAGLRDQIDYVNGSQMNYTYDNANRIDTIDNKQSGVTVSSHDYQYDLNGNRIQLTESNIDASQITTYQYDAADRLTQTNYPSYISTLTLDKVGNRTGEVIDDPINGINTITYTYNNRDQLTSMTDTDGNSTTYQYDAAGNQSEINNNGIITTLTYSPRQRVSSITQGANPTINYLYDADGLRVQKETAGQTTRYIYDDQAMIAETNAIGNTLARYYYSDTAIFAQTRNGNSSFFLQDALNTTVALTNQDGSVQVRYNYDVWGLRNNQTGSSDQPFGFTGYQLDETGLYYAQQRYYDPTTARFNREDPLQGNPQTPPSLHRYLYAFANPTVYIDPDGRESTGLGDDFGRSLGIDDDFLREINYQSRINSPYMFENIDLESLAELRKLEPDAGNPSIIFEGGDYKVSKARKLTPAQVRNNVLLRKLGIPRRKVAEAAQMAVCVYEGSCMGVDNNRRLTEKEVSALGIDSRFLIDKNSGFESAIFEHIRTKNLTFSIAGTDPKSFADIVTDVAQMRGLITKQYRQAGEIGKKLSFIAAQKGVELSVVGHSLGGGIAASTAIKTGRPAITINAAGLHEINKQEVFLEGSVFEVENDELITAFHIDGEVLSFLQDNFISRALFVPRAEGRRIEVERGDNSNFLSQHGSKKFCVSMGVNCDF